jgi:hypothetical protein
MSFASIVIPNGAVTVVSNAVMEIGSVVIFPDVSILRTDAFARSAMYVFPMESVHTE